MLLRFLAKTNLRCNPESLNSGKTGSGPGEPRPAEHGTHLRQRAKVFSICLLISAAIWLLVKLSHEYTQVVRFRVVYSGLHSGNMLAPATDTVLFAGIRASGFKVLYHNIFPRNRIINIDLDDYQPRLEGGNYLITIDNDMLGAKVDSLLSNKDKRISIYPGSITVKLEKALIRKIPVVPDLELGFQSQFALAGKILFSPDTILVTGKKELLAKIGQVKTEKKVLRNLSDNVFLTLKLVNNFGNYSVRYSSDYVKVFIPVVQFTEASIQVPVGVDSLPAGYEVITYPDKVNVIFQVGVNNYSKVSADSFRVTAPVNFHSQGRALPVRLNIGRSPGFVRVLRIEPSTVDYIIRK